MKRDAHVRLYYYLEMIKYHNVVLVGNESWYITIDVDYECQNERFSIND